jgi:F0F1-type ATP synthase membrane subunit b/b'
MRTKRQIHVESELHLGEILELVEIASGASIRRRSDSSINPLLEAHKLLPVQHPASPTRSKLEDFIHELRPSGNQLFLENEGGLLQCGILGGPGSGKTNLLIYLMRQLISLHADQPAHKFGGIILDPKAMLVHDVQQVFKEAGREQDLLIVNSQMLRERGGINLIDCMLAANDLGKALVLAAQSTGMGGREPSWNMHWNVHQMSNAFGAILYLLEFLHGRKPTLKEMMETALGNARDDKEAATVETKVSFQEAKKNVAKQLEKLIEKCRRKLKEEEADAEKKHQQAKADADQAALHPTPARQKAEEAAAQLKEARKKLEQLQDAEIRAEVLSQHGQADPKNRLMVEQFMEKAFSLFRDSAYSCYSTLHSSTTASDAPLSNLYDQAVNDGKVILVSPSPQEAELSAILPVLVKLIFQRVVMSRFERFTEGKLRNKVRPLLFVADEYHTVATQIEGERGDAEYFSLAPQYGGLSLVAAQSVKQLQTSGLKETWETVFGTLAAVIGLRQEDANTIEYLQRRGGKKQGLQTIQTDFIAEGKVTSTHTQRVEVPNIPTTALKAFKQGDAVVIATTSDHKAPCAIRFIHVPPAWSANEVILPRRDGFPLQEERQLEEV